MTSAIGFVLIGRDEGERLARCIAAAIRAAPRDEELRIVYCDSGSSDGSVERARAMGVEARMLDPEQPFTAARGRNEGFEALRARWPEVEHVQFVDGDCELFAGWCEAAAAFLSQRPDIAVVTGRLIEAHPERSVYNRLCQAEWDGPAGELAACGGIAMMRADAFRSVGGFRSDIAAGEEPELSIRLRDAGWALWRLDHDMAMHDADLTRFADWWKRMVRNGEGFLRIFLLQRASPHRIWRREILRTLFWGGALPSATLLGALLHPAALVLAVLYPAQMARIAWKRGAGRGFSWRYGFFMTVGKFAEFQGMVRLVLARVRPWSIVSPDR